MSIYDDLISQDTLAKITAQYEESIQVIQEHTENLEKQLRVREENNELTSEEIEQLRECYRLQEAEQILQAKKTLVLEKQIAIRSGQFRQEYDDIVKNGETSEYYQKMIQRSREESDREAIQSQGKLNALLTAGIRHHEIERDIRKEMLGYQRQEQEQKIKKLEKDLKDKTKSDKEKAEKVKELEQAKKAVKKTAAEQEKIEKEEQTEQTLQETLGKSGIAGAVSQVAFGGPTNLVAALGNLISSVSSRINSIIDTVDQNMELYSDYMGRVTARLQSLDGKSKTFDTIMETYDGGGFTASPYVRQVELYKNIDRLSSEGISYNIEERAFLASLADKMVASFNVSGQTLTRLIRVYQQDITQAMLGSEALLTQLFNMQYQDTAYLAQDIDESVLSNIAEALSTMSVENAVEFQYQIQKWLGSLYEVGVSDTTVNALASAINALGTGNVEQFTNEGIGTLLNMALKNAGYSVSDVLTQGLSADLVNDLLSSVISLLHDIKDNTSNQVTLAAYANVLGVSVSDIRGFYNLYDDIAVLKNYSTSLIEAESEVDSQIVSIVNERTTTQEAIKNVIENLGVAMGREISEDSYIAWLVGKTLVSAGSTIPGIVGGVVSLLGYADQLVIMASALGSALTNENLSVDESGDLDASSKKGALRGFKALFSADTWNNLFKSLSGESLLTFMTNTEGIDVVSSRGSTYGVVNPVYGGAANELSASYELQSKGTSEESTTALSPEQLSSRASRATTWALQSTPELLSTYEINKPTVSSVEENVSEQSKSDSAVKWYTPDEYAKLYSDYGLEKDATAPLPETEYMKEKSVAPSVQFILPETLNTQATTYNVQEGLESSIEFVRPETTTSQSGYEYKGQATPELLTDYGLTDKSQTKPIYGPTSTASRLTTYKSNELAYNSSLYDALIQNQRTRTGVSSLANYDNEYQISSGEAYEADVTEYDIYQELFYKHEHPIWVSVKDFQPDALDQLRIESTDDLAHRDTDNLKRIADCVLGDRMQVDFDTDTYYMLSSVRGEV